MTIRQWPLPVKKKAFQLYLQRYTAPEIERRTGVNKGTVRSWASNEKWFDVRDTVVLNLADAAQELVQEAAYGVLSALKNSSKVLTHIARHLEDENAVERLNAADLKTLADANAKAADVLLRVFDR